MKIKKIKTSSLFIILATICFFGQRHLHFGHQNESVQITHIVELLKKNEIRKVVIRNIDFPVEILSQKQKVFDCPWAFTSIKGFTVQENILCLDGTYLAPNAKKAGNVIRIALPEIDSVGIHQSGNVTFNGIKM